MSLANEILHKLIAKYEKSKASKGNASRNIKISLSIKDSIFDGHRNFDNGELDLALQTLEVNTYCYLKYEDGLFVEVILNKNQENIDAIYSLLKLSNPKNRKEELLLYLDSLKEIDNFTIQNIVKSFEESILKGNLKSVEKYFNSLDELKLIIKTIIEVDKLDTDIEERVFSIKHFGDSKTLLGIKNKVNRLLKLFSTEVFNDEDDPLSLLGVVSNTNYAFIKGKIIIKINEETINLEKYSHELALSDKMISEMEILSVLSPNVITIENLTSFNAFNNKDYVAIYLGGFHNKVKRNLLIKIYSFNQSLSFYHYGDIDAGGIYIFNHLKEKTNIPFKPYHMDKDTLLNYKEVSKKLTQNDKSKLQLMLGDSKFDAFKEIISLMLKYDIKIEQEIEI